jgi:hypothetical protein
METTLLDTFTAREISLELQIVRAWGGPEIDSFLRDVDSTPRPFDEWLSLANTWAAGFDCAAR